MPFDDELSKSRFARWLVHHSRLAGCDTTAIQTQMTILLLTGIALSDGLDATMTASLADALGVTPQDITTAYIGEMRRTVLTKIRSHPDLRALDAQLDQLLRNH
ncbi:hypothetical protein JK359_37400 [Streptomyces actinomycinicus]|uniref:Uncharacterized protein n=1 Tax=Streptomyces actinomycinicus TaxID=1695166 RepID=A0A937JR99_9ACTN|nr:hypothetical protein [Streptomyces actinomycinicus]MBL1087550.1 hypothetical protein [Streptomyces actinomycinicus]